MMSTKISSANQNQEKSFIKVAEHLKNEPFYKQVSWEGVFWVFGVPLISIYGLFTTQIQPNTIVFAIINYFIHFVSISAGYHRLWSHKSYKATELLQTILMIFASSALQHSAITWCKDHRSHHKHTDTDKDPYNAKRGFWFSHCGWLLYKNSIDKTTNVNDLEANPILKWQHTHFVWFGPFMCYLFPAIIAHLFWHDFRGGFFIAGATVCFISSQCTMTVNSLAHFPLPFSHQPHDDTNTPHNSFFVALLNGGEGYHNFHHAFPSDYRIGVRWFDYDLSKWFIYVCKCIGLAYDLQTFPSNEITRSEIDMKEKRLNEEKKSINYGVDLNTLPTWTDNQFKLKMKDAKRNGRILVIESNIVHDVTEFVASKKHPGGKSIIVQRNGKCITDDFNGNVYNHSTAARNLMSHWRIAIIVNNVSNNVS
eukprot:160591_1